MSKFVELASILLMGALMGLFLGIVLSGSMVRDWIKDGSFQYDCVKYKVERLNQ